MRYTRSWFFVLLLGCGQDSAPSAIESSIEIQFPWYFCIHGGEVDYSLDKAASAFQTVLDLGGVGVRTDIFWFDVEPKRNIWDARKVDFYAGYFDHAVADGLDPMAILSGAPDWALDLYKEDKAAFWSEYEEYIREVVTLVGAKTTRYQLWNEANGILDPIDAGDDWELFARAGAILRAQDPGSILFINAYANWLGWEEAVTDWVTKAGTFIDVIGVDHYPGTWSLGPFTNWWPVDRLLERIQTPGDVWYGKQGAVLETGFSTWAPDLADELDQVAWIDQSLPALRERVKSGPIVLGAFYQLIDANTAEWGHEAHFGILKSDLTPKPGYENLKQQIAQF